LAENDTYRTLSIAYGKDGFRKTLGLTNGVLYNPRKGLDRKRRLNN
jgi:hypothetical protein